MIIINSKTSSQSLPKLEAEKIRGAKAFCQGTRIFIHKKRNLHPYLTSSDRAYFN